MLFPTGSYDFLANLKIVLPPATAHARSPPIKGMRDIKPCLASTFVCSNSAEPHSPGTAGRNNEQEVNQASRLGKSDFKSFGYTASSSTAVRRGQTEQAYHRRSNQTPVASLFNPFLFACVPSHRVFYPKRGGLSGGGRCLVLG